MLKRINFLLALLAIIAVLFYVCSFEVSQGSIAIGAGSKIYPAGLQFKWPWQKITNLNISHQIVQMNTSGASWIIVAEIAQPQVYLKNSEGKSLADLIKQAWTGNASALQQNPSLTKNGIVVDSVIASGTNIADADQASILQNMQGLSTQIAQNILSEGEAQAQSSRTSAEASFLATQKQALDLAATVTGASQATAVKLLAPLYQKNPALFKAYMQAKTQLVFNSNS